MNARFLLFTGVGCVIIFVLVLFTAAPMPSAAAAPTTSVGNPGNDSGGVYYADCDAVRAAGVAPLRADQPGYRGGLDGNMNGYACEPPGWVGPAASTKAPSAASSTEPNHAPEMQPSPPPMDSPSVDPQPTDKPVRIE